MSEASDAENNKFTLAQMKNNFGIVFDCINQHKYVKVTLIKNFSHVGFIHSVDPVTFSVVLSVPQEAGYKTVIIPGHAVVEIESEEQPPNITPPQKKENQSESNQDILKRKTKLLSWFKTNLLPVTDLGDKIVIGNVTLLQPYTISDISTDNPIVAMQIRNVIEKMPEDFEPK